MASKSNESALTRFLCGLERFDRSPGCQEPVDIFLVLDRVRLPRVDLIGLQETEGDFEFLERLLRRALDRLSGEKDVAPNALKPNAVRLFGPAIPVEA